MDDVPRVRSFDETAVHIASLTARLRAVEHEVRHLAEAVDTLWTPPWKKVLFWLDGWPLYRVAEKRRWRPWHGWGSGRGH